LLKVLGNAMGIHLISRVPIGNNFSGMNEKNEAKSRGIKITF